MNVKILAAIALMFASGSGAAVEQNFPSVEVNAKAPFALEFDNIIVQRGANGGSLTWSRSNAISSSVALN